MGVWVVVEHGLGSEYVVVGVASFLPRVKAGH